MTTVPAPVADLLAQFGSLRARAARTAGRQFDHVHPEGATTVGNLLVAGVERSTDGDELLVAIDALSSFAGPAMAGPLDQLARYVVADLAQTTDRLAQAHQRADRAEQDRADQADVLRHVEDYLPTLGTELVQALAQSARAEALAAHLTAAIERLADTGYLAPDQAKDRIRRAHRRAAEEADADVARQYATDAWTDLP